MKMNFNKKYGLCSAALLLALLLLYFLVRDPAFNRSAANVMLVALIYCLIQSFVPANKKLSIFLSGILALALEITKTSGWAADWDLFEVLLGSEFDFDHVWSFVAGCAMLYLLEFYKDDGSPRRKKFFGF